MQIVSPSLDFSRVATSLSLASANYKPFPMAETTSSDAAAGRIAEVQGASQRPESEWGLPSVLHTSNDTQNGHAFSSNHNKSGKTVGNHGCTLVEEYTPKDSLNVQFPSFNRTRANMMRYREQMGVNTGSWFVLESWMAGSMFDCASGGKSAEYDFVNGYGTSKQGLSSARARLEKHWDTWIAEDDFSKMKEVGINTVRMPIGYWTAGPKHVKDTPFEKYADVYQNALKYLKRAIYWADKYDIGVILDLHAAYGAQNDQAHSGFSNGKVNFYSSHNRDKTKDFLVWLTKEFVSISNVIGIELLNEPQNHDKLWPWYGETMDAMRKANKYAKDLPLYFHDAFSPNQGASFVNKRSDFVVQDTHSYYVYTKQDQDMSANKHTSQIKGPILSEMQGNAKTARGNMVVGEWSCALNPNSLSQSKHKQRSNAQFCQAQTDTYRNATAGVLFWSWTMENCKQNSGWCFKAALPDFMDGTYNAWGFSDQVSNKTIETVSDSISDRELPTSYNTVKSQAGIPPTNNAKSCSTASSSASSNASAGTNGNVSNAGAPSGARNAQVQSASRVSRASSASSSSSSRRAKSHSSSKHGHAKHSSKHHASKHSTSSSSKSTGHKSHKSHHHSQHAKSSSHSHARRETMPGGGGPAARAAHLVRRAASETNAENLGYADGFVTARTLASELGLSRVGFVEQYLADTVEHYSKTKVLKSSTKKSYRKQFNSGLHNLERDIVRQVEKSVH